MEITVFALNSRIICIYALNEPQFIDLYIKPSILFL